MTQSGFAEFIEDRIADVVEPKDVKGAAADFLTKVGGTSYATPSRLLELSRSMHLTANVTVKNAVKLSSGEMVATYEESHETREQGNAPVKVPSAFLLGIPVFRGGDAFQVPVRLRYRLASGRLSWFYELYRPEVVFDVAIREACEEATEQTGCPLFMGAPE